ncbi:MAG: hypothetical protein IJU66_02245 [Oscillospiraceae bacterium]|nr:hypothetical protein [Oscillospiraceae bacterium]
MKYMHFRSSCAYTALAALMESRGVDTEDREIALGMKLPWLYAEENGGFAAGTMLQGAKWFDLWLAPRGYRMKETELSPRALASYLLEHAPVMLGLRTPRGKHAVVFEQFDGERYRFFNPVHEDSGEPTEWSLDEDELRERAEPPVVVGEVVSAEPRRQDMRPLFASSAAALRENRARIESFAAEKHTPDEYASAMDTLFRPLLLDGITMLELAGETELARGFSELQRAFLSFVRVPGDAPLCEAMSMSRLRELTEAYARLIERRLDRPADALYHGDGE